NHRGLDLHFHMPGELDAVENEIRAVIKSGVARGHLQIHVTLNRASAAGAAPLNRPLLHAYMSAFREAAGMYELKGEPDLNAALRIPGMLGSGVEEDLSEEVSRGVLEAAAEAIAIL